MSLTNIIIILLTAFHCIGQELTGDQLLEKAIAYHDPQGNWSSFVGDLTVTMSMPDKPDRVSELSMNLVEEFFQIISERDGIKIDRKLNKNVCSFLLNGRSEFFEEEKEKHKLTCDRTKLWRNYYTYLYGLPMKLKDPGTIIDPITQRKEFKGKTYLVLKVTYEAEVGKDTWYFYFDPETYAMEVYQFFKIESDNDGEYILLTGEEVISGIKMPKTRAWYYNEADKYLGTDVLTLSNR